MAVQDARVAAAVSHWAYRFTVNGTDHADFQATLARITRPLLVVAGGHGRIVVPAYHAERLAAEAPAAELALYPDGGHGVTNLAYESRSRGADWLASHLERR